MLIQLLYVSKAAPEVTPAETARILDASRRNNARLNVTGLLIYADDMFIQVLEGDAKAVDALVRRIQRDRRHRGLMVLVRRAVRARSFGEWSMGFRRLDPALEGERQAFELSQAALAERASPDADALFDVVRGFGGADFVPAD